MTNIASNILSSMMDAFASIISNNMNMVMKFLAAMTIVLTLPVVGRQLFGMNVPLPFQDWPFAFGVILLGIRGLAAFVARFYPQARLDVSGR